MEDGGDDPANPGADPSDSNAVVSLTDELSRRLVIRNSTAAETAAEAAEAARAQNRLLCEERHDSGDTSTDIKAVDAGIVSKWRQKEKLKTTAVALVLCLNIGVDPPDVIKISPCARLECWVDPLSMQPAKALETIGKNLQAQYERWQPRAKYKMHLDPTVEDVKKLCLSCRRNAKNERVLFHYNGHGVPRPTSNGEVWVFNSRYTQYIPLSIYELQGWLGTPCIYVLDCSAAGLIINSFRSFMDQRQQDLRMVQGGLNNYAPFAGASGSPGAVDPMKEVIVLAACSAHELLPQNPDLPADVFTACLTTPIKVALRWFCSRSLLRHDGITKELIDRIPGRQTDRKTPLGELNWIFTAITDTIAWNMLPRALFQKLFRSDLLVASLFRNFLLAERIMASANCTPVSYPRLPPTHQHPMWQAWDMASEMCLIQLPLLLSDPTAEFQPSAFFSEQLTAFELWLQHGSRDKKPPEQLPIVLQVLLSQVHRLRALVLLGRFLDMGPWAVDLALSVGIFPYVLKLLQTTSADLRSTLVFIWCKILALDKSCQVDLVKDNGHLYFIKYLDVYDAGVDMYSRAQASFVLAVICDAHPKGQALCLSSHLLVVLIKWLRTLYPQLPNATAAHALLLRWLCLCLGKLCEDMPEISLAAIREGAADLLVSLLSMSSPEIRAAAVFGLGCLVHSCPPDLDNGQQGAGEHTLSMTPSEDRLPAEQLIANAVRQVVYDPSTLVRGELAVLYARFVRGHAVYVREALHAHQRRLEETLPYTPGISSAAGSRRSVEVPPNSHHEGGASMGQSGGSVGSGMRGGGAGATPPTVASPGRAGAGGGGGGSAGDAADGRTSRNGVVSTTPSHPWGTSSSVDPAANTAGSSGADGSSSFGQPGGSKSPGLPPGVTGGGGGGAGEPSPSPVGVSKHMATYMTLLEAIQMLALDPSPKVAKLGREVLAVAHFELEFVTAAVGTSNGAISPRGGSTGSFSHRTRGPTARSAWRPSTPGASAPSSSAPRSAPSAASATSTPPTSSPASPSREVPLAYSRHPYILRTTSGLESMLGISTGDHSHHGGSMHGGDGSMHGGSHHGGSHHGGSHHGGSHHGPPIVGGSHHGGVGVSGSSHHGGTSPHMLHPPPDARTHGPSGGLQLPLLHASSNLSPGDLAGGGGMQKPPPLPQSLIYRLSCEYFSRPMLEPQASAWREAEGAALYSWTAPVDPNRRKHRAREIEAGLARCRAMVHPKLREQVYAIDTHSDAVSALSFHPYHPLLVTTDSRGYVRVTNYNDNNLANCFHVTNGAPMGDARVLPSSVVFLRQLNELEGPLLLAGSSDGAVRVWRSYALEKAQRMATALQAVQIQLPPAAGQPAVFEWSPPRSYLFAAGGSLPESVCCWDLNREMCCNLLHMGAHSPASAAAAGAAASPLAVPLSVDRLVLSQSNSNLLLSACSDGTLRIFDLRTGRGPELTLQPFLRGANLAGVVLEPNGRAGLVVAASDRGEMRFMDLLKASSNETGAVINTYQSSVAATLKTITAHSNGGVSALVSHPHAGLMATGTATQVVKLWTDTGDVVGAIRAQSSSLVHKMGPVDCMAFHPYQLMLAAGGGDSVCTVYVVDNQAQPSQPSGQALHSKA